MNKYPYYLSKYLNQEAPHRLKAEFVRHRISQRDMAAMLGIKASKLNAYLNGRSRMPPILEEEIISIIYERIGLINNDHALKFMLNILTKENK